MALEEAYLLNGDVLEVEAELLDELVLAADEEHAVVPSHTRPAEGDVGAHVALDGLVPDDVHVVIERDDRGVTLQVSHQDVLVVVEEVAAEDHRLRLVVH